MQPIRCLLSNFYLNIFRASLCPSSGEQDRVLPHMVFCTGCAGCGCVELGRKLCALCEGNLSQHNQCRISHAVFHGLVLLMMGIMMPETCWDRSLIINTWLVASRWFLSLHTTFMMHGQRNLKPSKCIIHSIVPISETALFEAVNVHPITLQKGPALRALRYRCACRISHMLLTGRNPSVRSIIQSCNLYISIYTYSHEHINITVSSDI